MKSKLRAAAMLLAVLILITALSGCVTKSAEELYCLPALSEEYEIISDEKIGNPDGFSYRVADVEDGFIKAVEANLGKASENVETLVPLYVKKSQAEEEE